MPKIRNVSKESILAYVWGYDSNAVENHVEVYIGFLRKKLNYPPYCFIVLIKITSKEFNYGIKEAKKISDFLKSNLDVKTTVLGPSMANVLRINNNYNFQVLLMIGSAKRTMMVITRWRFRTLPWLVLYPWLGNC